MRKSFCHGFYDPWLFLCLQQVSIWFSIVRICPRFCFCGESISKKCISPVRICLQTRNARNASTKFRKTSKPKKAEKSLEISAFLVFSCLHLNQTLNMAGRRLRRLFAHKSQAICMKPQAASPTPPAVAYFSCLPSLPKMAPACAGAFFGRDGRIRTYEDQSQSLVPYRLATSLYLKRILL